MFARRMATCWQANFGLLEKLAAKRGVVERRRHTKQHRLSSANFANLNWISSSAVKRLL